MVASGAVCECARKVHDSGLATSLPFVLPLFRSSGQLPADGRSPSIAKASASRFPSYSPRPSPLASDITVNSDDGLKEAP